MLRLNLEWKNYNTKFKDGIKEHYEMKVPCNGAYAVYNDGKEIYALQHGTYITNIGSFDTIDEAKKYCENHYIYEIMKLMKEM